MLANALALSMVSSTATSGGSKGSTIVTIPADLAGRWGSMSFIVYERPNGTGYSNIDYTNFRPTGTTNYFSPTGNDTTGNGTRANPYKTLEKGRTLNTVVYMLLPGNYTRSLNFTAANFTPAANQNVAFIAADGPGTVTISRAYDTLTWTQESAPNGNVYSTTAATLDMVIDTTNGQVGKYLADNINLVPTKLDVVASIAACQATPNTYYYTGTTLYVHTWNNRAPDSYINVLSTEGFIWFTGASTTATLYYEGLNLYGRRFGRTEHAAVNNNTFVQYKCNVHFSTEASMSPVRIQGTKNNWIKSCRYSDFTAADACSLSMGNTASQIAAPNGFFEDVDTWNCGNSGNTNFNAFTGHYLANAICINCTGDGFWGPLFAWVLGAYTLELNCSGQNSLVPNGAAAQQSIHQSGGTNDIDLTTVTKVWMRNCKSAGNNYGRAAVTSGGFQGLIYDMGGYVDTTTKGNYTGTIITPYP